MFYDSLEGWEWVRDGSKVEMISATRCLKWILTTLGLMAIATVKVKVKSLSRVRLFAIPWTVAHQTPPSMGFSRQEYWSGLPFPSPGGLPNPGIEPRSSALQADSFPAEPAEPPEKPWEGDWDSGSAQMTSGKLERISPFIPVSPFKTTAVQHK